MVGAASSEVVEVDALGATKVGLDGVVNADATGAEDTKRAVVARIEVSLTIVVMRDICVLMLVAVSCCLQSINWNKKKKVIKSN